MVLAGLAEATDLLDGWAARRFGTVSELGGLADPLCDSLARLTVFFAMALAGWVWIGVPLVMAGRDIVVAYIRIVLGRTGRKTSARVSGKLKAVVQGMAVFVLITLASEWAGAVDAVMWRNITGYVVIMVTVWSLVDYCRAGWPAILELGRSER